LNFRKPLETVVVLSCLICSQQTAESLYILPINLICNGVFEYNCVYILDFFSFVYYVVSFEDITDHSNFYKYPLLIVYNPSTLGP